MNCLEVTPAELDDLVTYSDNGSPPLIAVWNVIFTYDDEQYYTMTFTTQDAANEYSAWVDEMPDRRWHSIEETTIANRVEISSEEAALKENNESQR